jgi:phosphoribosyl-ATP pyrophosphohydrolase
MPVELTARGKIMGNEDILNKLYKVVLDRKSNPSEKSYTSSLFEKGIDKILKKVGEEATELIIAGKGGDRGEIIYETADLFFHTLILLGYHGIDPGDVFEELGRRFGVSGLEEKSSRSS